MVGEYIDFYNQRRIHISVFPVQHLDEVNDKLGCLVVACGNYYSREMTALRQSTNYTGKVITLSNFDLSLPESYENAQVMEDIQAVLELLSDQKSRMTYLLTWISRLANDETIATLFENETRETISDDNVIRYKDYLIKGINDPYIKKEFIADLYRMKYVYPDCGDVVLDVGAYRGDTAIFFADKVGSTGKVFAFEPIKANFDWLVDNIRDNRLDHIIVPVNKGCDGRSGLVKGVTVKSGAPWSFLSDEMGEQNIEVVELDEFVTDQQLEKVSYIKMDVEGFEERVIQGLSETIRSHKPKMVITLYHNTIDLTNLPLMISKLADYDMYVRCNMEGPFAVNLYCKPATKA
ncbi:methyltransferase, fkbm family, domain protein, putative [Heliomicrobium modesticaldum Ice1]|uniref:Methyltransferase, fkbm family, domain protein, putative n=1 Tax=Heliobacterium modesticaldum (strain ATCC 51547 / Ice1) TaxID=498761 RepID=B0TH27_HELMI|nr:methyltransferase, fkbm family, domain protein, putative [Heliomicrobium modesticaldum Ice1]